MMLSPSLNPCPDKEVVLPKPNVDYIAAYTRFLLLSLPDNGMLIKSIFAINKALIGIGGEAKSVKRLRSSNLLIETNSTLQTKSFLLAKSFLDSPVCHILTTPDADILDGFSDQGVIQVRRITIKKDNSVIPTKYLILTFNRPKLPTTIKAGYLNCKIRPYIPNPLRCFRSQRFGHSKTSCRGQLTCSRCASAGHSSTDCTLEPKCINCSQSHPSNSQLCPKWKLEKKQEIRTNNNISYIEAKKLLPPQLPQTYAQATKPSPISVTTQTDENITKIKCPPLNLLVEQNSLNELTPVYKKSRRRKTSKTSDATDTDADPSDTDYVTGLASEEYESLLEADFKQVSHTDDVKDIICQYHPVCVDTFLKSCHTTKIRRYGCVRKDTEGPSVSGGVCIFTSLDVPSSALPLHTSLQAVAVRIHSTSLITVCCLYLPPNTVIHQHDLNNLVDQLPAPFVILGDFNGHSTLRGSVKTNPRGRQIEQVLSDHCRCLRNHEEPTYFHEPTRSFHTLDLAICSPSLLPHLNLSVEKDLYNSDHFPVILSHDYDTGGKAFPPTYSYGRADWALFTQLAVITDAMVKTEIVDTAIHEVTNVLIAAAELSIPKSSSHFFQHYKPWWNIDCQTAEVMGNLSQISHYGESLGVQKGKSKCSQSKASESEAILDPICVLTHFVNVQ
ncbi:putative RNA-directed DNA polymerase from transposon X-element [Trichonephila clavipes]|nr:putative RNA-directed DNA polymerase from transposon X-element [Trichonephila clavipes]